MRLYTMHKREFVMVFLAFFACLGLGIFVGIAGKNSIDIFWRSRASEKLVIP